MMSGRDDGRCAMRCRSSDQDETLVMLALMVTVLLTALA